MYTLTFLEPFENTTDLEFFLLQDALSYATAYMEQGLDVVVLDPAGFPVNTSK